MESKYHCETRLNFLMMPAILFSTLATVFSGLTYFGNNRTCHSSYLECTNCIFVGISKLLKIGCCCRSAQNKPHQYDKLQTSIEFTWISFAI